MPIRLEDSVWDEDAYHHVLHIPDNATVEQCCHLLTNIKRVSAFNSTYVVRVDGITCDTKDVVNAIFFQGIKTNNKANQAIFDLYFLSQQ